MEESIEDLKKQLEQEQARSADLRIRLQRCRGALYCLRDPAGGNKPVSEWTWNLEAIRELQSHYDLPKLLAETRPEDSTGFEFLDRLKQLEETIAGLTTDKPVAT